MENPTTTLLAEKIGDQLGVPLDKWVADRRNAGMSFEEIAEETNLRIRETTPDENQRRRVSARSLLNWYPDIKRAKKVA